MSKQTALDREMEYNAINTLYWDIRALQDRICKRLDMHHIRATLDRRLNEDDLLNSDCELLAIIQERDTLLTRYENARAA